MRIVLFALTALAAACKDPEYGHPVRDPCSDSIAARTRGDYDRPMPGGPELSRAYERYMGSCQRICEKETALDGPACMEARLLGAGRYDQFDKLRREYCEDHASLYRNTCAWVSDRPMLLGSHKAVAVNREPTRRDDRRTENGGTGDPIDQVLARSDRELEAEGYEIVETIDRAVAGGAMTFGFSSHLTDRMLQIVCAAHEGFHGSARSGSSTAEFDRVDPGIDGAYVEHFAVPLDVNHAEQRFSVVPGWGAAARLACRVYKK